MRFSPLYLYNAIKEPLAYFFESYSPGGFSFSDDDEMKSDVLITSVDNYYLLKIEQKPRILIDRGSFSYNTSGLDNSLAFGEGPFANFGLSNQTNLAQITGESRILIEARNSGTSELLTDIVMHFLCWTGPLICTSAGFKTFGFPLNVGPCISNKDEDGSTIFQTTISIPWRTEEMWNFSEQGIKMKSFMMTFRPSLTPDVVTPVPGAAGVTTIIS